MILEFWQDQLFVSKLCLLAISYFFAISVWRCLCLVHGLQLFSWEPRVNQGAFLETVGKVQLRKRRIPRIPYLPPVETAAGLVGEAASPKWRLFLVEAEIFYAAELCAADIASIRRASGSILLLIAAMAAFDLGWKMHWAMHSNPRSSIAGLAAFLGMLETARHGLAASIFLFVSAGTFERKLAKRRAEWKRFFAISRAPTQVP